MLSKKDSYNNKGAFKYFIRDVTNAGIIPLCIRLPQMNAYTKYLLVCDELLIEKYNEIWNKIKNLFKKESDSEPVYNDKYIKTKINSYNMNFYGNKMSKKK